MERGLRTTERFLRFYTVTVAARTITIAACTVKGRTKRASGIHDWPEFDFTFIPTLPTPNYGEPRARINLARTRMNLSLSLFLSLCFSLTTAEFFLHPIVYFLALVSHELRNNNEKQSRFSIEVRGNLRSDLSRMSSVCLYIYREKGGNFFLFSSDTYKAGAS